MVLNSEQQWTYSEGISLRDYFAAAALTGWLSDGAIPSPKDAAISAYEYADAMLAAREGGENADDR